MQTVRVVFCFIMICYLPINLKITYLAMFNRTFDPMQSQESTIDNYMATTKQNRALILLGILYADNRPTSEMMRTSQ